MTYIASIALSDVAPRRHKRSVDQRDAIDAGVRGVNRLLASGVAAPVAEIADTSDRRGGTRLLASAC